MRDAKIPVREFKRKDAFGMHRSPGLPEPAALWQENGLSAFTGNSMLGRIDSSL
jgi:hypothetical protein